MQMGWQTDWLATSLALESLLVCCLPSSYQDRDTRCKSAADDARERWPFCKHSLSLSLSPISSSSLPSLGKRPRWRPTAHEMPSRHSWHLLLEWRMKNRLVQTLVMARLKILFLHTFKVIIVDNVFSIDLHTFYCSRFSALMNCWYKVSPRSSLVDAVGAWETMARLAIWAGHD